MFQAIENKFNRAIKKYYEFLNFHYFFTSEYPQYNLQRIYQDNESHRANLTRLGNTMVQIINQSPSPNTHASAAFQYNLLQVIRESFIAADIPLSDQIDLAIRQTQSSYMRTAENGILALTSASLFYYAFDFFNNLYHQPFLDDDEIDSSSKTSNTTISLCLFSALATGYWASRGFRTDLYNNPQDSQPPRNLLNDFQDTLNQTLNQSDIEQAFNLS